MIRTGFCRALARAGPRTSGWRIFCQSEVPRGVRPVRGQRGQFSISVSRTVAAKARRASHTETSRVATPSGVAPHTELTRELDLLDQLQRLLLRGDVVPLEPVVHEPDLDTVLVKQGRRVGNTGEDALVRQQDVPVFPVSMSCQKAPRR
jgi:hypothetical protein